MLLCKGEREEIVVGSRYIKQEAQSRWNKWSLGLGQQLWRWKDMDQLRIYSSELDLKELGDGLDVEAKVKMGITEEFQIEST